ncbi:MAG: Flp pilus assembly protein CpaB [Pirellulaceae bacterium]|nr:Flp pilus assembly protein CpaB [Pirellulaceae bacterium]
MKRISPGTVTVVVLALVCGLVAAYVVRQSLTPQPEVAQPQPEEPTVAIVVARNNLPVNTLITADDLQTLRVPVSKQPPDDAMRRAEVAVGRIVKSTIKAGQVMREEYLLGIGETLPGLAERIPAGHRALTIKVDHPAVDEAIEAGSLVDIAMSVEGDHPDLGELATRTLLRAVPVVNVARPDARRGNHNSGNIALTVAVTPRDANKLITAEQTGMLTVTMCSVQDGDQPLVEDDADAITRRELLGLRELPEPPAPPAPTPPPQPFKVEQFRGIRREVLELQPEGSSGPTSVTAETTPVQPQGTTSALVHPRVVGPPVATLGN